ncbi:MAG: universal stress protein [Planctomycetales bacterium]
MIKIKTILLPTDFSQASQEAARYALELARKFQARLLLLNVIEDPVLFLPMLDSFPLPTNEQMETYTEERLENFLSAEERGEVEVQLFWAHGRPFEEIVAFGARRKVDLIVMGTHGRGAAAHLILGSVAENVVRKAKCPVLTVHPEGHQFVHP